jgi:S-DNA-T family DNA segregation ATPase FtsK/SpoIIIE
MARNSMANAVPARRSGEVVGVVLIAAAVMLLAALLTFDPADTSLSNFPPNQTESNWIGPVGAKVANGLYLVFGLSALIFVGVLVLYGTSYFWRALEHVRARWPWMIGFLVACMGLFV